MCCMTRACVDGVGSVPGMFFFLCRLRYLPNGDLTEVSSRAVLAKVRLRKGGKTAREVEQWTRDESGA